MPHVDQSFILVNWKRGDVGIVFCKVCTSTSCCARASLFTSNRSPSPDMMTKASHCDRSASLASSRAWLCRSEKHAVYNSHDDNLPTFATMDECRVQSLVLEVMDAHVSLSSFIGVSAFTRSEHNGLNRQQRAQVMGPLCPKQVAQCEEQQAGGLD